MVLPMLIAGVVLLVIVVYIALKILKNVIIGVVMVGLVLVASFLIFGSFPNPKDIPFVGQYLPSLPTTPGEAIVVLRDVLYHVDILGYSRDNQGDLLVAVMNTGRMPVSNLTVYVDNSNVDIINSVKQTLPSKGVDVIQTDWKGSFSSILVGTNEANATYII